MTKTELGCTQCDWHLQKHNRRWLSSQQAEPSGFDKEAVMRLQKLDHHFWMRERRFLVEQLLVNNHLRGDDALELGCGTGNFLPIIERYYDRVTAIDAHEELLGIAEQHSSSAELIQSDVCHLPLKDNSFSLVIALDVIEHVDPDRLLREARRITRQGGTLLISAPCSPTLWSEMDVKAGHRCRYTKQQFMLELQRNGWEVSRSSYYQFLLYPLVWISSKLGARDDSRFERSPPAWLDLSLGAITRLESLISRIFPMPYGTSLFIIARAI